MSYLNETAEDRHWALSQAAKPFGIFPHSNGMMRLLSLLEGEGLVRRSERDPVWFITDRGRQSLSNGERQ